MKMITFIKIYLSLNYIFFIICQRIINKFIYIDIIPLLFWVYFWNKEQMNFH